MSEITLILIRHGEASQAWGDNLDPGLSIEGMKQSELLTENNKLQSLKDFTFISSPKSRALMTAAPLVNIYKKDLIIDPVFSEIPSDDIELADKRQWLTDIMKMDINSLPTMVSNWRDEILSKALTLNKDSIIFTHFMVINSIIGKLVGKPTLLYFYPDYTSITKIIIEDGIVKEFYVGGEKKTPINL